MGTIVFALHMADSPFSERPRYFAALRLLAMSGAFVVFFTVYAPRAGQGFISDDFEWSLSNRIESVGDFRRILTQHNGFYRPVVALTFSASEWLSGTDPRPYGLLNVLLALACALATAYLTRSIGLSRGASCLAASVWLLNVHGINVAILWLAGRTALLLTLGSVMSIATLVRGRLGFALAWMTIAVFSKEEAVLLPAIGAAWIWVLGDDDRRSLMLKWLLGSGAIVLLYLVVRSTTGAMTPFSAPTYYQFTFSPATVGRNVLEYADRTLTVTVVVALVMLAVLRSGWGWFDYKTKRILLACGVWIAGTYAITIFLPVRSSLYVCLPSVASAVALAAVGERAWSNATAARRVHALYAALILQLAMYPLHVARSERYTGNAVFSTNILEQLADLTASLPEGSAVVLHDDRSQRVNLESAFGNLIDEAYLFHTGRRVDFWIEPAVTYAPLTDRPCNGCAVAEFAVSDSKLRQVGGS